MEQGGFQFYVSLTEELPDEVKTGVAQFERVANVMVYKLNPFTLTGTVPCKYNHVYKISSVRMTSEWLIFAIPCLSFVIFLILMANDRQAWQFIEKTQTKVRNSIIMLILVCLSEFQVFK